MDILLKDIHQYEMLVENLLQNEDLKEEFMTLFKFDEKLSDEFRVRIEEIVYPLYHDKEIITKENILDMILLLCLWEKVVKMPTTKIYSNLVEHFYNDDLSWEMGFIEKVFVSHKKILHNPEKFFLEIYKDILLSDELTKIFTLNEDKLKEQTFFKESLRDYYISQGTSSFLFKSIQKFHKVIS